MGGPAMPEAAPEATPPVPWLFFLIAILVAVAVGAIIAYLGLTGRIGAGIPGSRSPSGGLVFALLGAFGELRSRRSVRRGSA